MKIRARKQDELSDSNEVLYIVEERKENGTSWDNYFDKIKA